MGWVHDKPIIPLYKVPMSAHFRVAVTHIEPRANDIQVADGLVLGPFKPGQKNPSAIHRGGGNRLPFHFGNSGKAIQWVTVSANGKPAEIQTPLRLLARQTLAPSVTMTSVSSGTISMGCHLPYI